MVQVRLLPLLAATFALHFTGRGVMALYQENQKKVRTFSEICFPFMHQTMSRKKKSGSKAPPLLLEVFD